MKQSLLLLMLFLTACSLYTPQKTEIIQPPLEGASCEGMDCLQMEKTFCDQAGGKWNECGSPCLGTGAEICIQVCSPQCECGQGTYDCPDGYYCRITGSFETELGTCSKA